MLPVIGALNLYTGVPPLVSVMLKVMCDPTTAKENVVSRRAAPFERHWTRAPEFTPFVDTPPEQSWRG